MMAAIGFLIIGTDERISRMLLLAMMVIIYVAMTTTTGLFCVGIPMTFTTAAPTAFLIHVDIMN